MKNTFEINNEPSVVKSFLSGLKSDFHFSKTFEGKIQYGKMEGYYSFLGVFSGVIIANIKLNGNYDFENGHLKITTSSSMFFKLMLLFLGILISISGILTVNIENFNYIGPILFSIIFLLISLSFILENRLLFRHFERLKNEILNSKK